MRTTQIKVGTEKREALLIAGGPGFKLYTSSGINGWILIIGRKNFVFLEADPEFQTIARYVNLKYQSASRQSEIKIQFSAVIERLSKIRAPFSELDL